jgi:hypothetical protein
VSKNINRLHNKLPYFAVTGDSGDNSLGVLAEMATLLDATGDIDDNLLFAEPTQRAKDPLINTRPNQTQCYYPI